jgi:ribosomal protein S18 acetylase RimI-like enzyme
MEQVQKLIPEVFTDLFARETGKPHYLPMRTKAEITSYMDKSPDGSLVAVTERGKVLGCVFCHRWGEIGWLGPLVVASAQQGRGIGSRLLSMATQYMKDTDCVVIGLETMPQTVGNISLYLRHGYYPENLRIRLGKDIDAEANFDCASLAYCLDRAQAEPFLPSVERISRAVDPLVDYTAEVEATYRFELGRCFFWQEERRTRGFMLYHWIPASSRVVIKAMACEPSGDSLEMFRNFLSACEQVLAQEGIRQLIAPVYGAHQRVLDILMRGNYRVLHAGVRMLYRGSRDQSDLVQRVHLAQWSG